MSSISGALAQPQISLPEFSRTSQVQARIESQVGRISDLFADIQSIMAEMAALTPPQAPGPQKDKEAQAAAQAAYAEALSQFQSQLQALNQKLTSTQQKLGQAQALLQRLQASDLPTAERQDADDMRRAVEQAREALEAQAEAIAAQSGADDEDLTTKTESLKAQIHKVDSEVKIDLKEDPTFQEVVKSFTLMLKLGNSTLANARADNPLTGGAKTPGAGLPPVHMP